MENFNIDESLKTAREKFGKQIPKFIFDMFISTDKTKTYKYIFKMCEFYSEGYNFNNIISLFKNYQELENYIKNIDITNLTFEDISDIIDNARKKKSKSRSELKRKMDNSHIIYSKENYRVCNITSFSDMRFYGKSTGWCISLNEVEYEMYAKKFDIYVIYNFNLTTEDIYYKTCLLLSDEVDMVVSKDNVHHYSKDKEFGSFIKKIYNEDIIKMFEL